MKNLLLRKVVWSLILAFIIFAAPAAPAYSEPVDSPSALPLFANVSAAAGIDTAVESWGAGWGDYNGDGYLDLIDYCHDMRIPELFRNNKDGTFTDIAGSTPLSNKTDRHTATWGDFDNDGDLDLYAGIGGQAGTGDHPKELFHNDDGALTDVSIPAGVVDGLARNRGASWADYDRDGYLDIYVANHEREGLTSRLWHNNGNGTFTNKATEAGVADNIGTHFGSFIDYDRDGWPDIFLMGISENKLYHNKGNGTFELVSAGIDLSKGGGDTYAWGDYDNDGLADLFVVSAKDIPVDYVGIFGEEIQFSGEDNKEEDGFDFTVASDEISFNLEMRGPDTCTTPDCIYIGADGHHPDASTFTTGTDAYGAPAGYSPGVSLGYYIWRDTGTDRWHVRMSTYAIFKYGGIITATDPITDVNLVSMETEQPLGVTILWHNLGGGKFARAGAAAGLDLIGNFRTANWVDFDNDGFLDLFVVNTGNLVTGNLPDRLYHNNGNGTFTDVAASVGVGGTTVGEGSVSIWGDYDRDGFLDLFTQNGGNSGSWPVFPLGSNELFHNQGNGNHWIQLDLVGQESSRSGLGAVVRLQAGGRIQTLTMDDGLAAYAQYGNPLHFGLGSATTIDWIRIRWPSGITQLLTDVSVDQFLSITEEQFPPLQYSYLGLIQR